MNKLTEVLTINENNEIMPKWDIKQIFDEIFGGHPIQVNPLDAVVRKMNSTEEYEAEGNNGRKEA